MKFWTTYIDSFGLPEYILVLKFLKSDKKIIGHHLVAISMNFSLELVPNKIWFGALGRI